MMNSNHTVKYEYVDDVSVDSELICSICNKPFCEPISTPCDHIFCRNCISRWLEKKKKTCPTCRTCIKSIEEFSQVSRPLRNMLDRLPIKCIVCGQTGLQKDQFNDHINKFCPKSKVSCTAADIKCSWNGFREELSTHLSTCKFEPLRFFLTDVIHLNEHLLNEQQNLTNQLKQLNELTKQQNIQIIELTNKLSTLNHVLPVLEKSPEGEANSIIDFSNQKITDRDLTNLSQQMLTKPFTIIQLQGNAITSYGLNILINNFLKNSTSIRDLWLNNNCISDHGINELVNSYLMSNSTLKQLHLGSNFLTDKGVCHIAELLELNTSITDLWLYNNNITDNGVRVLTDVLRTENRTLKHLDLQWNKLITDKSIERLVKMLESNKSFERLNLRKCNISPDGKIKLLQAISEKKDFKLYM